MSPQGYFLVVAAPLQVVLLGGSVRVVSSRRPLQLDAVRSVDLNERDLRKVSFSWACVPEPGSECPFRTAVGKYLSPRCCLPAPGGSDVDLLQASEPRWLRVLFGTASASSWS